ncbi:MAG TPA: response regulator transcription factor, partial [Dehalococcoidia bacterium]|nr:response regulator transcription factor [Dehalococcoidia bacterium]
MLPGIHGFELARRARARSIRVPILMLTARGAVTDRVRGLDSGADDYLVKPFMMAEFLARVRALARRPAVAAEEVLRVGAIEMDTRIRGVRVAGTAVDLTAKEYALLELFLRNPGAILSRAQILDRVWSFDYDGQSNVVETYIRYLRKKLGTTREMLQTVRGMGYRLDAGP